MPVDPNVIAQAIGQFCSVPSARPIFILFIPPGTLSQARLCHPLRGVVMRLQRIFVPPPSGVCNAVSDGFITTLGGIVPVYFISRNINFLYAIALYKK